MRTKELTRTLSVLLALCLVASACSSGESSTTSAEIVEEPAAEVDDGEDVQDVVEEDLADDDNEDPELDDDEDPDHDADVAATTINFGLFEDGALSTDAVLGECVLTDGSTSECYTITVVGTPVGQDVGPFCPTTIDADASEGGLWLDGEASYEIDGPFFTELAEIYGDELWDNIYNDDGTVNVIDNAEDFAVAARPDITEEFYYHCVDGDVSWLDGGEQPSHAIVVPATPTLSDAVTVEFATGAHSNLGVTLNGALVSGSADMTAILASYTIAAFDDCGGHINPALGYHVHGTAGCSDADEVADGETAPFAIAIDGFPIHAPYDDDVEVALDECNGHTTDELGYHYHANNIEENATLTCLMGEVAEGQDAGGRPAGPADGGGRGGPPPDDQ